MTILAKRQVIVPDVGGEGELWGVSNRPLIDTTQSVFPPPPNFLNNFEYISRSEVINSQNKRHFFYVHYYTVYNTFFFFFFFSSTRFFVSLCKLLKKPPQWLRNNGSQSPEHSTEL